MVVTVVITIPWPEISLVKAPNLPWSQERRAKWTWHPREIVSQLSIRDGDDSDPNPNIFWSWPRIDCKLQTKERARGRAQYLPLTHVLFLVRQPNSPNCMDILRMPKSHSRAHEVALDGWMNRGSTLFQSIYALAASRIQLSWSWLYRSTVLFDHFYGFRDSKRNSSAPVQPCFNHWSLSLFSR